jgi:hypothetical protein
MCVYGSMVQGDIRATLAGCGATRIKLPVSSFGWKKGPEQSQHWRLTYKYFLHGSSTLLSPGLRTEPNVTLIPCEALVGGNIQPAPHHFSAACRDLIPGYCVPL